MTHGAMNRFADYPVPTGAATPCPFCGSVNLMFYMDPRQGWKYGGVACLCCGAKGPESRTNYDNSPDGANWHDEALKLWGERA